MRLSASKHVAPRVYSGRDRIEQVVNPSSATQSGSVNDTGEDSAHLGYCKGVRQAP